MSGVYVTPLSEEISSINFSEKEIQSAAEEKIFEHGDDAMAEAQKKIRDLNARGEFSLAGAWVLVCQRIRELQAILEGKPDRSAVLVDRPLPCADVLRMRAPVD